MFGGHPPGPGALTQGGLGLAAGGNINPQGVSMFEPIGGSAPKYTGQGKANPLAAILAGQMMLDELQEAQAAQAVEQAVTRLLPAMDSLAAGRMGMTTDEVGDRVAEGVA